jgi:hypothetical protein
MHMPSRAFQSLDRHLKMQEALDAAFQRIEADFNAQGFSTREIHDAMGEVLDTRRQALVEDPDPSDDPA